MAIREFNARYGFGFPDGTGRSDCCDDMTMLIMSEYAEERGDSSIATMLSNALTGIAPSSPNPTTTAIDPIPGSTPTGFSAVQTEPKRQAARAERNGQPVAVSISVRTTTKGITNEVVINIAGADEVHISSAPQTSSK